MPYRFERLDTATTPDQLRTLLPVMEQHQYDYTQYIAVQCYERAAGPLMSRGKAAPWYDDFNPDQLCLPFEGFTPVEVQSIYNNFSPELGEGWVICYSRPNSRRHTEITFHERQTYAPNRILSLSVFKQVPVDRGALRPFVQLSRLEDSPPIRWPGDRPSPVSRELIELAMLPGVRDALQGEVGRLTEINQLVVLDVDGGVFHSLQTDAPVARLIRAVVSQEQCQIRFTVSLPNGSRAVIFVHQQSTAQAETTWHS